mgnify:CR=1 FL=1
MSMFTRYAAWLSGALLVVASIGVAHAEYVDPPGRVARLSYTRGDVSFSPGGESDWARPHPDLHAAGALLRHPRARPEGYFVARRRVDLYA